MSPIGAYPGFNSDSSSDLPLSSQLQWLLLHLVHELAVVPNPPKIHSFQLLTHLKVK